MAEAAGRAGNYRWRICALLFFATTINYVDRNVLGVLAPELQRVIGWNEIQYANIVNAFTAAYAIGLLFAGRFIDRVGTRVGYGCTIGVWSLAAMGHALVRTVPGFGVARFFLGLGEAGNFPAAIKTVAEWFPTKERALATGIFNSGANIGAMAAPVMVAFLNARFGWQSAFVATGIFSLLWLIIWLRSYRPPQDHPGVSTAELRWIQSDSAAPSGSIPWTALIGHRQTWAYIAGKALTDPIWWFFVFWLPKFLNEQHHLSLTQLGWPIVFIYNMATLGSLAGGWLSARFFRLGWSVNRARKTTMLICALAVVPIIFGATVAHLWIAVSLIGLAVASHQGWSANMFTVASDLFPRYAVGSVVGIGGFCGMLTSMAIATFTGFVLELTRSYVPMFVIAGSIYLVALLLVHLLAPRFDPAAIAPISAQS